VVAVKGSLRRASPALDRAHRTLFNTLPPTRISKEAHFTAVYNEHSPGLFSASVRSKGAQLRHTIVNLCY